jgi:hypothetical protein
MVAMVAMVAVVAVVTAAQEKEEEEEAEVRAPVRNHVSWLRAIDTHESWTRKDVLSDILYSLHVRSIAKINAAKVGGRYPSPRPTIYSL